MILNRLGNKSKLVDKLLPLFPRHDIYMEMFLGAGGMFFNKPRAKYNFINDLDHDVYNLFRQVLDNKEELLEWIIKTPITERQFKEWGKGKREDTDLMNAIRFIWISNFGLYGKPNTLRIGAVNPRAMILKNMEQTFEWLSNAYLFNVDFRKFFSKCDYKGNIQRCFVYADPPYLNTDNNYSDGFVEQDSIDLFNTLCNSGVKFAMSEFDHPVIMREVEKRGLNLIVIGERQNIANRRVEVLVTNYNTNQTSLF